MKLEEVVKGMIDFEIIGDPTQMINGLSYDSRSVKPGDLFIALKGHGQDGHKFFEEALSNGAVALVGERFPGIREDVTKIRVPDSREALSKMAIQYYGRPFDGLNLIGITGTNGKTTTSYLLESILVASGAKPGVVGTINYRFLGKTRPAPVTTPESLDLMRLLREMADGGATDVIMEVSSHALDQKRTEGCPFKVAIFTNFTRDHLDYHHSMEGYFRAKSLLFRNLARGKTEDENFAVLNMDDPKGEELAAITNAKVVTYGLKRTSDVKADSISADKGGLKGKLLTPIGERSFRSALIGEINIYNILSASAAAVALNIDLDKVVEGIESLHTVPGRLEPVPNPRGLTILVDYAHTPDALKKALRDVKPFVRGKSIYKDNISPVLGQFDPELHENFFPGGTVAPASIALLPIVRKHQLAGSFNIGSMDEKRFNDYAGKDFLTHLAAIIAVCIDNHLGKEHLKYLGLIDNLTGVNNRRFFDQRLEEETARVNRSKTPISCLFVDIDYFKKINDTYGHQVGDQVLRHIAQIIREQVRAIDIVARYGGEEFTVILLQAGEKKAWEIAERIRTTIEQENYYSDSGQRIPLTASIGINTLLPEDCLSDFKGVAKQFVERADQALYAAKNRGRNRTVCSSNINTEKSP